MDRFHETILTYLKQVPTDTAAAKQRLFLEKTIGFGDFYFDNIKNKKQLNALENQLELIEKTVNNANLVKVHAKILYRLEQNERAVLLLEKAMESVADKADFADILQKMKDKKL